ncbi:MAG: hypothetical protein HYT21_02305 [Candidatus Nealsonbacteria bacterium]|nr:hypothetical protein [Candidatus Nealsonbacteria bacterium]
MSQNTEKILLGLVLLAFVILVPIAADKLNLRASVSDPPAPSAPANHEDILAQINPVEGYTVNATYGDIGPQLITAGAIDFEKMKALYEQSGKPLTDEQITILTEGSNEKIKISPENSYFLLNFLWAMGITNKNRILDEGPIMKYGEDQVGRFASTGGWTLGTAPSTEFFSKYSIVTLSEEQQAILEDFAFNSYRPCCNNPTGFPDCNHGAAALALGEIMASQGATSEEIFEAFKYFNSFWFPQTYFDIATYFQAKEGKNWAEAPGRVVAGKEYSTPQGWQATRRWLTENGLLEETPEGGGTCGV